MNKSICINLCKYFFIKTATKRNAKHHAEAVYSQKGHRRNNCRLLCKLPVT